MIHAARSVPYEELERALEARVAQGAVARTDDGPLRLYIYSNRCVYDRLWDDVSVLARGLVLDRAARVVRATPFQEGFVVRFASGLRLKLKGAAYRRVHALLSNTTPLGLWRGLDAGDDLDGVRREIPEEFWADFDRIRGLLGDRIAAVVGRVEAVHGGWTDRTDKELGLALATIDPAVRRYLFARRKLGVAWTADPQLRRLLLKDVRPDGNVLDGYLPSTYMLGALDPEG